MTKVWQEDDAIPPHHEDYESAGSAYARMNPTESAVPVKVEDHGDEDWKWMANGWLVVVSAARNSRIYKPQVPSTTLCQDNHFVFGVVNTFTYKNHRGEVSKRKAVPLHLTYGRKCDHCPESTDTTAGWLLVGFDMDRNALRHYTLSDIEPR